MDTFKVKFRIWNPAAARACRGTGWLCRYRRGFQLGLAGTARTLGPKPTRRMPFRTIEGRVLEREMAAVYVGTDGYSAPDVVVIAEPGEMEVLGAHSIEGLEMAPIQFRRNWCLGSCWRWRFLRLTGTRMASFWQESQAWMTFSGVPFAGIR